MKRRRPKRPRNGRNPLSPQAQRAVLEARTAVETAIRQQLAEVEQLKREAAERLRQGLRTINEEAAKALKETTSVTDDAAKRNQ